MEKSKKYVPSYLEVERTQKEARRIGRKEEKIEIAKESLKEGLSVEVISKITGLSKEEIDQLK